MNLGLPRNGEGLARVRIPARDVRCHRSGLSVDLVGGLSVSWLGDLDNHVFVLLLRRPRRGRPPSLRNVVGVYSHWRTSYLIPVYGIEQQWTYTPDECPARAQGLWEFPITAESAEDFGPMGSPPGTIDGALWRLRALAPWPAPYKFNTLGQWRQRLTPNPGKYLRPDQVIGGIYSITPNGDGVLMTAELPKDPAGQCSEHRLWSARYGVGRFQPRVQSLDVVKDLAQARLPEEFGARVGDWWRLAPSALVGPVGRRHVPLAQQHWLDRLHAFRGSWGYYDEDFERHISSAPRPAHGWLRRLRLAALRAGDRPTETPMTDWPGFKPDPEDLVARPAPVEPVTRVHVGNLRRTPGRPWHAHRRWFQRQIP